MTQRLVSLDNGNALTRLLARDTDIHTEYRSLTERIAQNSVQYGIPMEAERSGKTLFTFYFNKDHAPETSKPIIEAIIRLTRHVENAIDYHSLISATLLSRNARITNDDLDRYINDSDSYVTEFDRYVAALTIEHEALEDIKMPELRILIEQIKTSFKTFKADITKQPGLDARMKKTPV